MPGSKPGYGGVGIGAGERGVDRVVGVRRADLPALRVQDPVPERVPVGHERGLDPVDQPLHGLGLRLRRRARPAVGVAGLRGRRALVVVVEVLVEVAVGVDAVAGRDLAVAVVVPQVLPPQPLDVERVLVAVGVGHDDEPQLGVLQEAPDLSVVGPPAVDHVVQRPSIDLDRDPLTGVLRRRVEHGGAAAVADAPGALGDLERDELAALVGLPQHLELHELGVVGGDLVQLVADAPGLVPRPPDVNPPSAWSSAASRAV